MCCPWTIGCSTRAGCSRAGTTWTGATTSSGRKWRISPRLSGYRWPGNVRELRNVIERAVIVARRGWVESVHLPPFIRSRKSESSGAIVLPAGSTVADAEKLLILETLKQMDNNKSRAARALGIDVKTIRYKLRAYRESQ